MNSTSQPFGHRATWLMVTSISAALLFTACSTSGDMQDELPSPATSEPLTGEAAVAELRTIFDKYAVNDELCEEQIKAIADDEYVGLDTTGNGIPGDDPNNPYAEYDKSKDGVITKEEFEAGEYAAAKKNVDTNGSGCITFEELKKYQGL